MLYRPLFLAAVVALFGALTGCTGLTKPDSITISAEPAADAPAAKAGQAPAPQQARQPTPLPAMPAPAPAPADGCGE